MVSGVSPASRLASPRAAPFTGGSVVSADGTVIGYRQLGRGPAVLLLHGGLMASQNFTTLGAALADDFSVILPDRRGRGASGPFGDGYGTQKEREDVAALLEKTGARCVFGLSSGAIIALQAAVTLPIRKLALYEPPLILPGSADPSHLAPHLAWVPRYEREIARGKLASAMITVIRGTVGPSGIARLPRFVLTPLFHLAIKSDARSVEAGRVPLGALIPTMHYDAQLVAETKGALESFRAVQSDVLLLGGRESAPYLGEALDALAGVLPRSRRVEFPGVGHLAADNSGKPELVAAELRAFFG